MFCKSALVAAVLVGLAIANPAGSREMFDTEKMPEFLTSLPQEAQNEFATIVKNKELTIADQHAQLLAWAEKNGLGDKVAEFEKRIVEKMNTIKSAIDADGSIPEAKLNEIRDILKNENQTRHQQIEALIAFKNNNKEIADKLEAIIKPEMQFDH